MLMNECARLIAISVCGNMNYVRPSELLCIRFLLRYLYMLCIP